MATKENRQTARARLAEERRIAEQAARRKRMIGIVAIALAVILIAVGIFWAVGAANRGREAEGGGEGGQGYVTTIQDIPTATLDAVGAGSLARDPSTVIPGGQPQLVDGKPRLLYVGAEYCSFCGFTRWPLTIALSRFGDFTDLKAARTPSGGALGNIPTVTYLDSTYSSDHLVFKGYELADANGQPIEQLTTEDDAITKQYGMQGYPWLYWGTRTSGTPFEQAFLQGGFMPGEDGDAIAAKLEDPNSPEAQAILGAANVTTAQICEITGGQPGDVCTSPGVEAAKGLLG